MGLVRSYQKNIDFYLQVLIWIELIVTVYSNVRLYYSPKISENTSGYQANGDVIPAPSSDLENEIHKENALRSSYVCRRGYRPFRQHWMRSPD